MRRTATVGVVGVVAVAALAGVATGEKTVQIPVPDVEMKFNGGFKPKALSKSESTPIVFSISGDIKSVRSWHPPALHEFILEGDKNAAIDVKGLPTCRLSGLRSSTDIADVEAKCRSSIVGRGHLTVQIAFPETPVLTQSRIIVLNGGFRGGVTTLFVHAYITIPVPAAIVTTVKIKKIRKGRYGLLSVASIPKIAGGSGSVTHFDLEINKRGVLTAKCTDGKLQVHGTAVFTQGPTLAATVSRPCTPKP